MAPELAQVLVNGVLLGGVYAIVSVGFTLVYGVMGIINLAHASLIMLGSYLGFSLNSYLGLDLFVSIPFVMISMFLVSFIIQLIALNPLIKRGYVGMTVVATFGIDLILINIALLVWSADYRGVVPSYGSTVFAFLGIRLPLIRLLIFLLSLLFTLLLWLFLRKTKTGKAIRAVSANREAAGLMGIDVYRIYAITFAIGGALAGAAGALLSPISSIHPNMGLPLLGPVFAVAVLGGLGDVVGAILAGLALGIAEVAGVYVLGASVQVLISYAVFILVLLVRPQGIRGVKFVR